MFGNHKLIDILSTLAGVAIFVTLVTLFPMGLFIFLFILFVLREKGDLHDTPIDRFSQASEAKRQQRVDDLSDLVDWLSHTSSPTTTATVPEDTSTTLTIPNTSTTYDQRQEKQVYMRSDTWNKLRKSVLKRDNYSCQGCNIEDVSLEVHHITYKRLYKERKSDLVSLCRNCHQEIHAKYGYEYDREYPLKK